MHRSVGHFINVPFYQINADHVVCFAKPTPHTLTSRRRRNTTTSSERICRVWATAMQVDLDLESGHIDLLCFQRCDLTCFVGPCVRFGKPNRSSSQMIFGGKCIMINGLTGAWRAGTDNTNQWIEADFRVMRRIISVTTQADSMTGHRVTRYTISHSHNRIYWNNIPDQFDGNGDSTWPKTNMLPGSRLARYIRLFPRAWHMSISLAWDIAWCRVTRE